MNTSAIHLAIGFFILLVIGMGLYTYLEKADQELQQQSDTLPANMPDGDGIAPTTPTSSSTQTPAPSRETSPPPVTPDDETAVTGTTEMMTVTRTFAEGTHTLTGEVMKPTPCHELRHDVAIAESYPEQVRINFTTLSTSKLCTQVISPESFTIAVNASQEASFTFFVDGVSQQIDW